MRSLQSFSVILSVGGALGFVPGLPLPVARRSTTSRLAVPLELEGQIDPSRSWDVTMTFNGETKVLNISEGESLLEAAEKEWDAPFSCRNGICTTCAARVNAGRDSVKTAIHGLSPEQSANGFILTCQSHPAGPGIDVELGMYDVVYEQQYGKHEKKATSSLEKKRKFNVFGFESAVARHAMEHSLLTGNCS